MSIRSRLFGAMLGITRPTYTLYPLQTGANVPGALLTPAAAGWGLYTDIIAAKAIAVEFWLIEAVFDTAAGAFVLHEVQIFNATEARTVYECRVVPGAATVNMTPFPMSIPIYCAPNDQIQGITGATNAADTIRCSLLVATGL